MASSGRQPVVRRRTVVALTIAATILLPLALPAVAENLSSGTAAGTAPLADGLLNTANKGVATTTGAVQQVGTGTPLQPVTNAASSTTQKTVTGATGIVRQPAGPAPAVVPNPPPAPAPAPAPLAVAPSAASPGALGDVSSLTPVAGSASGLQVGAATLLLANEASIAPLVAEALSAAPSALVLVAEPLARSLNLPLASPDGPTSDAQQVEPVNLTQGLLTEALIAMVLLIAATAALIAEMGLKRSAPRPT
ncbi:MAG: hypothetical protein ABR592_03340 [Nitriliruptorales bacterium]